MKYTIGYPKLRKLFVEDPELQLITQCYRKANAIRYKVQIREQSSKIKHFGKYTILYKGILVDKLVSKVIRLIDTIEIKQDYVEE